MKRVLSIAALLCCVALNVRAQVRVSGFVKDSATNQPLSGAIVDIAGPNRRYSVRTDETGEFRVTVLNEGLHTASVRRIGYAAYRHAVNIAEEMNPIEIGLAPIPQALGEVLVRGKGAGIYGHIGTSSDLTPIEGARVYIGGSRDSVLTDSAGAYFLPVKRAGIYMIRVSSPGYAEELYVVDVKKDQVADGSRLLDLGERGHMPDILWKDLDQRLSWRTTNHAAVIPGSEIRRSGGSMAGALSQSGAIIAHGMRLGGSVCIFVNGQPRPGYPLNAIRPEEVKAIEAYGPKTDVAHFLQMDWPPNRGCSGTGERIPRGATPIGYLVIWTR